MTTISEAGWDQEVADARAEGAVQGRELGLCDIVSVQTLEGDIAMVELCSSRMRGPAGWLAIAFFFARARSVWHRLHHHEGRRDVLRCAARSDP